MEDYKKKYEESMKRTAVFIKRGSLTADFAKAIFDDFEMESEDERMLKECSIAISASEMHTLDEKRKMEIWLKSLKDRVQPKSKQEWSEEDEKMIRGLIAICDEWTTSHSFYPIENCDIKKLKSWLKCLKERYTWKPSDEQMEVLEWSLHNWTGKTKEILESLQSDLKKLREDKL